MKKQNSENLLLLLYAFIQERQGLLLLLTGFVYMDFMIGSECNLGLSYLCLTDMDEDTVVLSGGPKQRKVDRGG